MSAKTLSSVAAAALLFVLFISLPHRHAEFANDTETAQSEYVPMQYAIQATRLQPYVETF